MINQNSLIGISGKSQAGKNTIADIIQWLKTRPDMSFSSFILLEKYEREEKWKQVSFARKVKEVVSILTGINVDDLEKQEVKNRVLGCEWGRYIRYRHTREVFSHAPAANIPFEKMTVRQLLQEVGTNAIRDVIHPDVWINALFADYYETRGMEAVPDHRKHLYACNWLITDVRFPNELEAIKLRGGIVIRVERNTELRYPELWGEFQQQTKYDEWDDFLKTRNQFKNVYHPSESSLDNATFDLIIENNSGLEDLIKGVKTVFKT